MTFPGPARYAALSLAGAALALAGVLAGCSSGHGAVATGPQDGDTGYVSPDRTVQVIARNDREAAPTIRGDLLDGGTFDVHDRVDRVVVVNFWASWCPPCRSEQPRLNEVYAATHAMGVDFVGVDLRDDDSAARAFRRTHAVGYPSIVDESGSVLLGFRDIPASPPSTVVIDRTGRVAAKIIGQTPPGVLQPIVEAIAGEAAPS